MSESGNYSDDTERKCALDGCRKNPAGGTVLYCSTAHELADDDEEVWVEP